MDKKTQTFKIKKSKYLFVKDLVKGNDPLTGKKLFTPSQELESALDTLSLFVLRYDKLDADCFRAINSQEARDSQAKRIVEQKREKQVKNRNVGLRWTEDEDRELVIEYKQNMSIEEMIKKHDRTRSAIERRLLKLLPISEIRK